MEDNNKRALNILIVEDDLVNSKLLQGMLCKTVLFVDEVKSAASLGAALELLDENQFDVVLLDLNLPDSKGIDTLITINRRHPDVAIVVITGEYDDEIGLKAITSGAQEYLTRGRYDTYLLGKSISYALERRRAGEKIKNLAKFPSEDPSPVLRISKDYEILYANDSSWPILGAWKCKQGQYLSGAERKLIEKVFHSGKTFTFDLNCGDIIFSVTIVPVTECGYVNVYALDITELRLSKMNLKQAREQAEAKSLFISTVSHELQTPLVCMKESVAIILDELIGEINEEQRKTLDITQRNIDRLARLIGGVLDFQKLGAGKTKFNMQENDINEVARDIYETMSPPASGVKLDFFLELDENLPKAVFDRDKIMQVLTNIVSNALKFTENGSVTIATTRKKNAVQISVSDTGPGIKQEDIAKIFDEFEQVFDSNERKTGGVGLGLAIVRKIIEEHNGNIQVQSEVGIGTKFIVSIPIQQEVMPLHSAVTYT